MEQQMADLYREGKSLSDIGKILGLSTTTVFRRFRKHNIPTDPIRRKRGAENHLYKGGIIFRNGYVMLLKRDHPKSNYGGYVREHILVMEEFIGRYVKEGEIVHHRNSNKVDNRLENLMLISDSEHRKIHAEMRKRNKLGRFT